MDALNDDPADRVPIFPSVTGWAAINLSSVPLADTARDSKRIIDAQINAMEMIGHDALTACADALYVPEAFGCKIRFPATGPIADPLSLDINEPKDLDRIRIPDPREEGRFPVIHETIRGLNAYGRGDIPVLGLFEAAFTTTCRLFEPDLILRMIYKNRPLLETLLDKINDFLLAFGLALIESGANGIFLPDPTASSTMISPLMFKQIVLPRLQRLISKLDVPCILHICGNTSPILKMMEETGAAVLSLDQCMGLQESRSMVPRAVLGGNVDPIESLLLGTPEKVVEDTLHCLRTAGTSRFILMSGCGVPPKTPLENLKAMVETAKTYGLGPLC
jgi:[methyl-Co(III) methanol-specific corrinoid protein]:coenzyme M methyltransferase